MKAQAGIISGKENQQENGTDDASDTVTFHDAVNHDDNDAYIESDEEDVLIEDLPLESEEDMDDRLPRKSDINFDQFSLGWNRKGFLLSIYFHRLIDFDSFMLIFM